MKMPYSKIQENLFNLAARQAVALLISHKIKIPLSRDWILWRWRDWTRVYKMKGTVST